MTEGYDDEEAIFAALDKYCEAVEASGGWIVSGFSVAPLPLDDQQIRRKC